MWVLIGLDAQLEDYKGHCFVYPWMMFGCIINKYYEIENLKCIVAKSISW